MVPFGVWSSCLVSILVAKLLFGEERSCRQRGTATEASGRKSAVDK